MKNFKDWLEIALFVIVISLCIGFACLVFIKPMQLSEQKPPLHKVKVIWEQANEYPMSIDGVMDGDVVRIK